MCDGVFGVQNLWCEVDISGELDRERIFWFGAKISYMIALCWTIFGRTNPIVDNLNVSELLISNGKQWNSNLIYTLVGGGDAAKVLKSPLFEVVQIDKLVWNFEKNVRFSVHSVYRYCIKDVIDSCHIRIGEKWELI